MNRKFLTLAAGALMLGMSSMSAQAAGKNICVSWKTFQEERWKTDEAAIKAVVEAAGNKYASADAQGSAAKQLTDIEGLITQGCNVILVVAFDSDAILPAFQAAADAGVKMISYDVLVEHPDALYVTFDNVGVGRLMAKTMLEKGKSEGDFAFIKGDKGDPNATFLFQGIMEVLKPNMDAGKIKNVCETFTDGWKPDAAQKNMEQCLTSVNNKVDAVISAERRHGRRRRCRPRSPGPRRHRAGHRSGRRQGRAEPRGAWHAAGVGVEGRARPRQGRRRIRQHDRRRQGRDRTSGRGQVLGRRQGR